MPAPVGMARAEHQEHEQEWETNAALQDLRVLGRPNVTWWLFSQLALRGLVIGNDESGFVKENGV